jgi:hypothetical protein
MRSKL